MTASDTILWTQDVIWMYTRRSKTLWTSSKRLTKAGIRSCSVKKVFLEILQNLQKNTCVKVSFLITLQVSACNFIKKETLAQVFSRKFCEISKNSFSYRTPVMTVCGLMYVQFMPLHKKWSFPLRISSVNVTKSAGNCGFDHIYWKNL